MRQSDLLFPRCHRCVCPSAPRVSGHKQLITKSKFQILFPQKCAEKSMNQVQNQIVGDRFCCPNRFETFVDLSVPAIATGLQATCEQHVSHDALSLVRALCAALNNQSDQQQSKQMSKSSRAEAPFCSCPTGSPPRIAPTLKRQARASLCYVTATSNCFYTENASRPPAFTPQSTRIQPSFNPHSTLIQPSRIIREGCGWHLAVGHHYA